MKKDREPTYSFEILTVVLIFIDTVLAWVSIAALPVAAAPGVSVLYVAVAFMILFTLWFGAYGAIAAYVGTLIGGGFLSGIDPRVAIFWAVAGLLQALIPLIAFRSFDVDLTLSNTRDWTYLLLFGVLINNFIGAAWGSITLAIGGVIPNSAITGVLFSWFLGDVIVTIIILPIALSRLTMRINKSSLFVKNYWN